MAISFTTEAAQVWRDYNTDGQASSGKFSPRKSDIRTWGTEVENFLKGAANLDNIQITGGNITGIADLPVADGGTGASTAAQARTNLGLQIGADVVSWDPVHDIIGASDLTAAEVAQVENINASVISAAQWGYLAAMSAFGGSLVDDADAGAALTTLGISAFIKTLLDDVDAPTARGTLDVYATSEASAAADSDDFFGEFTASGGTIEVPNLAWNDANVIGYYMEFGDIAIDSWSVDLRIQGSGDNGVTWNTTAANYAHYYETMTISLGTRTDTFVSGGDADGLNTGINLFSTDTAAGWLNFRKAGNMFVHGVGSTSTNEFIRFHGRVYQTGSGLSAVRFWLPGQSIPAGGWVRVWEKRR